MCGIAGAIANGKSKITMKNIKAMALGIERRGKHAYGLAWIGQDGRVRMHKWCGPISDNLSVFDNIHAPRAIIIHTRWATHGNCEANENNHPHPVDTGWLVHNGQIPNYNDLIDEFDLLASSECDSEVLGLLMTEFSGTVLERAKATIDLCDDTRPLCMAAIFPNPTRLVLAKRGNPLHVSVGSSGNLYFSSCDVGLPAGSRVMEENVVFCHTLKNDSKSTSKHLPLKPFKDTGIKVAGSGSSMSKSNTSSNNNWYETQRAREARLAQEAAEEAADPTAENLWDVDDDDRWDEVVNEQGHLRAIALRHLESATGETPRLTREEGMRKQKFISTNKTKNKGKAKAKNRGKGKRR